MQPYPLAKTFWEKLIRFGQIWLDLGDIWAYLSKIWAGLIRFGQNQNLASPKKFDLLWLCQSVFYSSAV